MKKVRVISDFVDKFDTKVIYHIGDEKSFSEERVADMVKRGLAVLIEEEQKVEEPKEAAKVEAEKAEAKVEDAVVAEAEQKVETEEPKVEKPVAKKPSKPRV